MNWENTRPTNYRHTSRYTTTETGNSFFKGVLKIAFGIVLAAIILFVINIGLAIGILSALSKVFNQAISNVTGQHPIVATAPQTRRPPAEAQRHQQPDSAQILINRPQQQNAETIIGQAPTGGYWIEGWINNVKVNLHADTGADMVNVPAHIATRAGLKPGRRLRLTTASDVVPNYQTTIQEIRFGNITLHNVPATINPSAPDNQVLLGMTALQRLSIRVEKGQMILSSSQPILRAEHQTEQQTAPRPFIRSLQQCSKHTGIIDNEVLHCLQGLAPTPTQPN